MECPICRDHFKPDDSNIIVVKHNSDKSVACSKKRGHFFHKDCMIRWGKKICPLDRDTYTRMYHIDYRILDGLDLCDFECYYMLLKDIKISDDVIRNIKHINNQDEKGKTLFYLACQYNNLKLAKKLFRTGSDPLISNNDEFTPLMIAICNGHQDIYQYLFRNKSVRENVGVVDKKGYSAFDYAIRNANIKAVQEFLNWYLVDVNTIDRVLIYCQKRLMTRKNKDGDVILGELNLYCKLLKTNLE